MPFAPFPRPPHRVAPPAPELRRERTQPASPCPGPLARAQVRLAPAPDPDATRAWAAHLAAGRIGAAMPAPDPAGRDYRLAGLARLLGRRA